MPVSELKIKNMVCPRCIKVVDEELNKLGHTIKDIKLGEVIVDDTLNIEQLTQIKEVLRKNGFELIDDKKSRIIEKIKTEKICKKI